MRGPESPFRPDFPDDFIQQAGEAVRRRTEPYYLVQRYRLALLIRENRDMSNEEAGRITGLSRRQVIRWRKRWASGDFTVADKPGRGQKPVFSPIGSRCCESSSM
ncbi:MAG: helix-turn-helix domain-containing protein [Desulfobacterales bacterium]|nr:helix-turn-helix domain-containing protein [Desulfobacterales bacterium]